MSFNENTRVKIPALLHLHRLGYEYLSLKDSTWDIEANIFTDIFTQAVIRLNGGEFDEDDATRLLQDISLALSNEDLGHAFFEMLTSTSGVKLFDFKHIENNDFHVVTELTCKNGDDEFRPDITLLINGMPLVFIEVKKPNNRDGVLAERDRINVRFKNKKFRKFINISQILVFTNNMEYDSEMVEPIQGAYYATTSYSDASFNYFREQESLDLATLLTPEDDDVENFVLTDNNLIAIKHSPEFLTNKDPNTPTNRILTSLFSKERLAWLLKYAFAYLRTENGQLQKHIMRYPQIFATKAIEQKLDEGETKGIVWHTQGSGKTALAFYNVHYLTDYFQKKGVVPKFYFIVDRIDLMIQAMKEFSSRDLHVHTVDSKDALLQDFHSQKALYNHQGKREITVVNIQKFKEDNDIFQQAAYDLNIQRVYFLDEVHRSYNPTGSFLANLYSSDRGAILIGLTGTPLIGKERNSRSIFGGYFHTYYYNASIADGYTLKLIREGIETKYRIQLEQALKEIEIVKNAIDRREAYAHERFVEPMLDYVVEDFINSRRRFNDHSIGGMVVCDSAAQARTMFRIFVNKYNPQQETVEEVGDYASINEPTATYTTYTERHEARLKASLILHDVGTGDDRKKEIERFKDGKIDLLFVYNMLLTGFDAHRLKKLYMGRLVRDHNLLQTLTRVNRPYKDFRYGYVVDFADIRKEFDDTNKAYFDELQEELGDEIKTYSNLFKSKEEIEAELVEIKDALFHYDLENAENFSTQISAIQDRRTVLEIKKALENARSLYNLIRLYEHFYLLDAVDFKQLNRLFYEASRHLDLLNLKESLENNLETTHLLNEALENVVFMFTKISEEEMVMADRLKDMLRKTREALGDNFDQADPQFVSLYEALKALFNKKNLDEITQDEMKENIGSLQQIYDAVTELNRKNNLLKEKYRNDRKYARLHKRIWEKQGITKRESELYNALIGIKAGVDEKVLLNEALLNNESYFAGMVMPNVIQSFDKMKVQLAPDSAHYINGLLVREYMAEYQGNVS
jgi:type I restriction enzyme R subunit